MSVVEHHNGNTTITKHYRCKVCGFKGSDSITFLATESGAHRPSVSTTYAPWWCQEHGEEAMERYEPEEAVEHNLREFLGERSGQ